MSYVYLSTNSKLMKRAYRAYIASEWHSLDDAYQSVSESKYDSWETCKKIMNEKNGRNLKVITKNIYQYAAGFVFDHAGKEFFCYITKEYNRVASVDYCLMPE